MYSTYLHVNVLNSVQHTVDGWNPMTHCPFSLNAMQDKYIAVLHLNFEDIHKKRKEKAKNGQSKKKTRKTDTLPFTRP